MLNKLLFILLLATFSHANFTGLTPSQLQDKIDKNIVVIDIRTAPEWKQTGIIPTSKELMFFNELGQFNTKLWIQELHKIIKNKNEPFILICRSGNRTNQVGNFLSKQLKYKNVFHLEHGINSWIKQNRQVIKEN